MMFFYVLFSYTAGVHDTAHDAGHVFGPSGAAHGDGGHLGYDTHGHFGELMAHHNGAATHEGDIGKNNILFANDIIHHGDGGVYVSSGDNSSVPNTLSLDDIHHRMSDAMADAHNASIAGKEAARKAEMLKASIAAERAKQKEEELATLKELDDAAAKQEHLRPEVLGKKTIPVATFTQESFPLFHHVRQLLAKIKAIQDTEQKAIQAQATITRLDDITDEIRLQDVGLENPHAYQNFLAAGNANDFMFHVPVVDPAGDFYISNASTHSNVGTHDVPMKEKTYPDGHSHFVDHGDVTDADLGQGGASVGTPHDVIV